MVLLTTAAAPPAEGQALTREQRNELVSQMRAKTLEMQQVRRDIREYQQTREAVPAELKTKHDQLQAELRQMREDLRTGTDRPTRDGDGATNPVDANDAFIGAITHAPTAKAIEMAMQIVQAYPEYDQAMRAVPTAMLDENRDPKEFDQIRRRYYSAKSGLRSLEKGRPTLNFADLLTHCPAQFRGPWPQVTRWSDEQRKAFSDWASHWVETRIAFEGTVESSSFNRLPKLRCVAVVDVEGVKVQIPVTIESSTTYGFMAEPAQKGDQIKTQVVIKDFVSFTIESGIPQIKLNAELESAELYRKTAGGAVDRVWPDMTSLARRIGLMNSKRRALNLQGDALFPKARKDPKLRDKSIHIFVRHEELDEICTTAWHPFVTIEQWLAGCPSDSHGPWDAPQRWTEAQKTAFGRWVALSEDVRLLSPFAVEEIGKTTKLQAEATVDGAPVTIQITARLIRPADLEVGRSYHGSFTLDNRQNWKVEGNRIVVELVAKLHRVSDQPLNEKGRPVDARR